MPKVVVCLLTYNRFEYAEITLRSTLDNLVYSEPISVHVADDGSGGDYAQRLLDIAGGYPNVFGISASNSQRGGYGRNVNLATQTMHTFADYILMLEDDWRLTRKLDIDALITDMQASQGAVDCVRLGYLSFTQQLFAEILCLGPHGSKYARLLADSPEPHIFAGHPRLETKQRQVEMGLWPEGRLPGDTEFMMAHTKRARQGVAWPMDLVMPKGDLYSHIGSIRAW